MKRPSYKELTSKLKQACEFVKNEQVFVINQSALAVDALELEYSIEDDLLEVLNELLEKQIPPTIPEADRPKDPMRMRFQV